MDISLAQHFRPGQDRRQRSCIMETMQIENFWPAVKVISMLLSHFWFLQFLTSGHSLSQTWPSFFSPSLFFPLCYTLLLYYFLDRFDLSNLVPIMRFVWFTAALVVGCVGAPMGSEVKTRTMKPVCTLLGHSLFLSVCAVEVSVCWCLMVI